MDYKEIYEKILGEYRQVFERVDQDNMRAFIDEVKAHDRIFLIGVGREGMATRAFAMRLMHMGKEIHWIWDDTTPSIGEGGSRLKAGLFHKTTTGKPEDENP